jgi:hypothetical protein
MGLREWAQKALREVEQDGTAARCVRLTTPGDGTTWETWNHPFPDVETFLNESAGVIDGIANECPVRRVPLMFTAETATGTVLTQFPTSVQGKNKQADALAGSGNNAAKAFAEGMEGLSRVMAAVLKSAEVQVTSLTKTLESQANQIHELIEYHRAKQELELTEERENTNAQGMMMDQLKEVLPLIPQALELFLQDKKISNAADLAKATAAAVTKTTNGAKV